MPSRAQVLHDYPWGKPPPRVRRPVSFRWNADDPVNLPRTSLWRDGAGVIIAALATVAIVGSAAYSAYARGPRLLIETPTLPHEGRWQPDPDLVQAHVTNALSGPALAAPSGGAGPHAFDMVMPMPAPERAHPSSDRPATGEVIIDDAAPGAQDSFPQGPDRSAFGPAEPAETETTPYPNPTTTPPELLTPPAQPAELPAPSHAPDNPYRD